MIAGALAGTGSPGTTGGAYEEPFSGVAIGVAATEAAATEAVAAGLIAAGAAVSCGADLEVSAPVFLGDAAAGLAYFAHCAISASSLLGIQLFTAL